MALSTTPVFAQAPKTNGITFAAASQTTVMEPATVSPTTLVTAGSDGAIVTSVKVFSEETTTAEKFVLWIQPLGTGNWYIINQATLAAHTEAVAAAQPDTPLVDKSIETDAIRLAATDKLGVTHHVDQQSMVVAEFTNF